MTTLALNYFYDRQDDGAQQITLNLTDAAAPDVRANLGMWTTRHDVTTW